MRDRLDAYSLSVWEKAVFYHFVHALGMLIVPLIAKGAPFGEWVEWLVVAGIVLFSGSLYLLAVTGTRWMGAITPLGGLCFLAGWALLVYAGIRG